MRINFVSITVGGPHDLLIAWPRFGFSLRPFHLYARAFGRVFGLAENLELERDESAAVDPAPQQPELELEARRKRYVRVPELDLRIARGDDFAGDAWRNLRTGQVSYTVVGYDLNAADGSELVLEDCPACGGSGATRWSGLAHPCATCNGTGTALVERIVLSGSAS